MNVLFLGKDQRYEVIIDYLNKTHNVECIGYDNQKIGSLEHIDKYDIIILPMYGIKNGMIDNIQITESIINKIRDDCIIYTGLKPKELAYKKIISFMDDEKINDENNQITVEGIIDNIKDKDKSMICILGYGKIGKLLYDKLKSDYFVLVGVKKETDFLSRGVCFETGNLDCLKRNLQSSTIIINTIPKNIITEDIASNIKGYILDIASSPYGIKQSLVSKYHLNYYLYSSIPAKYDPKRAGKLLLKKFRR